MKYLLFKSFIKKIIKSKNVYNIFPESGIIYVHIPKTGGISIKDLLRKLRNPKLTSNEKKKYYLFEELKRKKISSIHGKAKDYIKFIDSHTWNKSIKFASIRNPWNLMVSSYNWWLQEGYKFQRCRHMYNDICDMSFKEFINSSYGQNMINDCIGNIEDWINDQNGKFILDSLVRLEYFDEDFEKLLKNFNHPIKGFRKLKRLNYTSHKRYQDYYDDNSKKMIERRFNFIIKKYDYKF